MKDIKRLVCFIITVTVIFASVSAFAEYQYIDPIEYMDSIYAHDMDGFEIDGEETEGNVSVNDKLRFEHLQRLGIWDDAEKNPQEFITEKELDIVLGRAVLGIGNAFEEAYLNEPDGDYVSYENLYERLIENLGYSYRYKEDGAKRTLLSVANDIGIIPDGADQIDLNGFVTRSAFAEITEKALLVDLCEKVYYQSGYSFNVLKGQNLLNTVHKVHCFEGMVNAIEGIAIYGNTVDRSDVFQIDGQNITTNGIDVAEYFGKWVTGYARYDEKRGKYLLVSVKESDEVEYYEIDFSDIISMNDNNVEYEDESGKIKKINTSALNNILVNGSKYASLSDCADCIGKDGKIIITSSKSGNTLDCAVLWVYDYYIVSYNSINQNRIGIDGNLKYNGNSYIEIGEDVVISVSIDGKAAYSEDIPVGAAVCVAASDDGKYIRISAAEQTKAEGTVSKTEKDNVFIDDIKYTVSKTLQEYIRLCEENEDIDANDVVKPFEAGVSGVFYTYGNKIIGFKANNVYSYAYLRAVANNNDGIDNDVKIKIFTSDGEWKVYSLADKLEFDGVEKNKKDVYSTIEADDSIVDEIVRYKINTKNLVIGLDTINNTPYESDDAYSVRFEEMWKGGMAWTYEYLEDSKYWLDDKTVIFGIPTDLTDEDEYKVLRNTSLPYDSEKSPEIKLNLYSANDFNIVRAAVWEGGKAAAGSISFYMHIENINTVINEKEEIEYKLVGTEYRNLRARAKGTCLSTEVMITEKMFNASDIKVGQFVGASIVDGYVESVKIYSDDGRVPATDRKTSESTYAYVAVGTIKKIDYSTNRVLVEYIDESGETQELLTIPRAKGIININRNKTFNSELSDFAPGDRVMFYDNIGQGSWIFKNE